MSFWAHPERVLDDWARQATSGFVAHAIQARGSGRGCGRARSGRGCLGPALWPPTAAWHIRRRNAAGHKHPHI